MISAHPTTASRQFSRICALAAILMSQWPFGPAWAQVLPTGVLGTSPETAAPVYAARGGVPLVMLTLARDHTLFFPAYNDLSDLDGDGELDIRFKPAFEYAGLYNSHYCYLYDGTGNKEHFYPDQDLGTALGPCSQSGTQSKWWSGNFLNYVTTSRMDALRVALYGGTRELEDVKDNFTMLRRAYIPQDGHAWAKEYTSVAVDGYDISQYTPLALPTSSTARHFFGNLTSTIDGLDPTKIYSYDNNGTDFPPVGKSCSTLNDCSKYPPLLRVISNSNKRVWEWASTERPVLNALAQPKSWGAAITSYGQGKLIDYTVRVKVCVGTYVNGCKKYPNGNYKPIGVLHEYGEDDSMYFGLLTGSYDQNLSGGRLRKNIGSFKNEVDANTGMFAAPANSIVDQINKIRIRNFNYYAGPTDNKQGGYYSGNFIYRNGTIAPANIYGDNIFDSSYGSYNNKTGTYHLMAEGEYADWGNPVAEMMYEGLRYFAGKTATIAYNNGGFDEDRDVGLQQTTWVDPYNTGLNWCAKPSQMVISSVNPSFDSDQLPGSNFLTGGAWPDSLQAANGTVLNVTSLATAIGASEGLGSADVFIGESPSSNDGAPTLKPLGELGKVRGLPPDDTNKQGSYYAAAVAKFAKENALRNFGTNGNPKEVRVDTFSVLMNSPIPQIVIPFAGGKKISVVPFARTIDAPNATKGEFQPTNQIVGMYITQFENPTNNNGTGGYHLHFLINYEDRSWGGDFEMDAIAEYDITADSTQVTIKVTPTYGASGSKQNMGYVIAGTGGKDGPYLVVQNTNASAPYYLNVPPGQIPGYCANAAVPADCNTLPNLPSNGSSTKYFEPALSPANNYLKDPLWYAAKWGGYSGDVAPTTAGGNDPDSYAQVSSPAKLRSAFAKAFNTILNRNSTTGAVSASSSQLIDDTKLFQAKFNLKYFFGDLEATRFSVAPGTGTINDQANYDFKWSAASKLMTDLKANGADSRNIYYKNPSAGSTESKPFTSINTSTDYPNANLTSDVVSYLRGDQAKETWQAGGVFRSRRNTDTTNGVTTNIDNVLGGLINSAPFYSDDTKTVYVGANDGMLHAFNSEDGSERFAYMPAAVIPKLYKLSEPGYSHRYYVDGNIAVSNRNDTGGVNYLVGFMGRGAKGLYGLQVGKAGTAAYPQGFNKLVGAWENFGTTDDDMGYLLGKPLIEKLQDGTDVVIFGNGYNSTRNKATLYVVNLKTGFVIAKYQTDQGSNNAFNGLATPAVTRKDGRVEYVYAGDYWGYVWKFDLFDLSVGSVTQVFDTRQNSGKIFNIFKATDDAGIPQVITAPMATAFVSYTNNSNQVISDRFVYFGTGSDLTVPDSNLTSPNSMYGLIDKNLRGNPIVLVARANLRRRTIQATGTYNKFQVIKTVGVRSFSTWNKGTSNNPLSDDMNGQSGWYMNWTTPGGPSEKVVSAAAVRNASTPTLVVSSNIFSSESCDAVGKGFLNAMDAYGGGGLTESYFDINRNRQFSDETFKGQNGADNIISSIDFGIGNIGQGGFPGNNVVVQGAKGPDSTSTKGGKLKSSRISWREIVK